jgi:hypothetical protein
MRTHKLHVAMAAILVSAAALYFIRERRAGERERALEALSAAAARLDDQASSEAIRRFTENQPLFGADSRTPWVLAIREGLTAWPNRRMRDAAYDRLMKAAGQDDEDGVRREAQSFIAASSGSKEDPRRAQVDQIVASSRTWSRGRTLDSAYNRVSEAAARDDDGGVIRASDEFLATAGNELLAGGDPRASQVSSLRDQAKAAPGRRARDAAYARLIQLLPSVEGTRPDSDEEACRAAERFLAAPPPVGEDSRAAQVRELMRRVQDAPRRRVLELTYRSLIEAARRDDDRTVIERAKAFLDSAASDGADSRVPQVRELQKYAAAAPDRRRRDESYTCLINAYALGDENEVLKQAKAFLGASRDENVNPQERSRPLADSNVTEGVAPVVDSDPRSSQVSKLANEAREWPRLRTRDSAFAHLQKMIEGKNDREAILAAENFLGAPPLIRADGRTDQVKRWYREAFVRWFAAQPAEDEMKERVGRYRTLLEETGR